MENFNNPAEINGIVVEESLISGWPESFSGGWINLSPASDDIFNYSAELIFSDENDEGSIIKSNSSRFPNCASIISWQATGEITYLWVKEEYRNVGIGYSMGLWLRTYLAKNYGVRAHHPMINERNEDVESLIKLFKITYNDSDIILIEDSNDSNL